MKKLILSAWFALVCCSSYAQDDVYSMNDNQSLKNLMSVKKDRFANTFWVKYKPYSNGYDYYNLGLSFQLNSGIANNLRLQARYMGNAWIFIKKIMFLINDDTFELVPEKVAKTVVNGVHEEVDIAVQNLQPALLEAIFKAEKIEIRFIGENSFKDKFVSNSDIKRLKSVLKYYVSLGGKI